MRSLLLRSGPQSNRVSRNRGASGNAKLKRTPKRSLSQNVAYTQSLCYCDGSLRPRKAILASHTKTGAMSAEFWAMALATDLKPRYAKIGAQSCRACGPDEHRPIEVLYLSRRTLL